MSSLVRYRAWIVMGAVLVAVLAAGLLAGHRRGPHVSATGRPRVSFGSQVAKLGGTGQLVYTNGWVAAGGRQTIGVYAGSQASNRDNGLFVILRQTPGPHPQRLSSVVVRGSGPVTLLRPAPPTSEQAAFEETLHFVAANGGTGTLDLGRDSVSLSR